MMGAQEFITYCQITSSVHQHSIYVKWFFPATTHFKLNTDGAFKNSAAPSGIRVVIRDNQGNCVVGFNKSTFGFNYTYMELLALQTGPKITCERNLVPLEMETRLHGNHTTFRK